MKQHLFLRRVVLRNYKSIGVCDVQLGPLTYLVGANGAGKSNFLDAMHLVKDALNTSLDNALNERGGLPNVRRYSSGHPHHFGIRLEFQLVDGRKGHYSFNVGAIKGRTWEVQTEECQVGEIGKGPYFRISRGKVEVCSEAAAPAISPDRLALVAFSGFSSFRPVFDALTAMGFYNLNPKLMRELQKPQDGRLLKSAGENIVSVIGHLEKSSRQSLDRVREYLGLVVPMVEGVSRIEFGPMETLEFRQEMAGAKHPWRFRAHNMSDGTLRALGILVALFQGNQDYVPTVIGIEEPETALHPAASGALRSALLTASRQTQVIVTSHSPELLDDYDIPPEAIYSVVSVGGETTIAPLDAASREAMKEHLFSAGELLRLNQLAQDTSVLQELARRQPDLFGDRGISDPSEP